MPSLIDGHNHMGLVNERDGSNAKSNYTRAQAIVAATSTNARLLHLDKLGTISVGKMRGSTCSRPIRLRTF